MGRGGGGGRWQAEDAQAEAAGLDPEQAARAAHHQLPQRLADRPRPGGPGGQLCTRYCSLVLDHLQTGRGLVGAEQVFGLQQEVLKIEVVSAGEAQSAELHDLTLIINAVAEHFFKVRGYFEQTLYFLCKTA